MLFALALTRWLLSSAIGFRLQAVRENDLAEAEKRDPLNRLADWLIGNDLASVDDLEKAARDEEQRIEETFKQVAGEIK